MLRACLNRRVYDDSASPYACRVSKLQSRSTSAPPAGRPDAAVLPAMTMRMFSIGDHFRFVGRRGRPRSR